MTRTLEQELQASLVGRTIEEVKYDYRNGLAVMRCSDGHGGDDAYFCFSERSFADAAALWSGLR
jgi:hypothetical protein